MTRWVVDSSIIIDATRGHPEAIDVLRAAADRGEIWSVTPVRTEVGWGIRPGERPQMVELLGAIRWLEVAPSLADHAGELGRRWGRSHGLGVVDALLAAATEELGAELLTTNVRDFPMFPGLEAPYRMRQ
ncbi:MAG: PIN domain-containing protein [Candidatus Limnocylindrales bacterium]